MIGGNAVTQKIRMSPFSTGPRRPAKVGTKKSRYSEEQIDMALRLGELGTPRLAALRSTPHVLRTTAATNALDHQAEIARFRSGSVTPISKRPGSFEDRVLAEAV